MVFHEATFSMNLKKVIPYHRTSISNFLQLFLIRNEKSLNWYIQYSSWVTESEIRNQKTIQKLMIHDDTSKTFLVWTNHCNLQNRQSALCQLWAGMHSRPNLKPLNYLGLIKSLISTVFEDNVTIKRFNERPFLQGIGDIPCFNWIMIQQLLMKSDWSVYKILLQITSRFCVKQLHIMIFQDELERFNRKRLD